MAHGDESEKAELHEFIEKLSLRTVDGKRLIPKKRCYAAEAILRDIQNKKDMIQLLTTDPNLVGEEQPGE